MYLLTIENADCTEGQKLMGKWMYCRVQSMKWRCKSAYSFSDYIGLSSIVQFELFDFLVLFVFTVVNVMSPSADYMHIRCIICRIDRNWESVIHYACFNIDCRLTICSRRILSYKNSLRVCHLSSLVPSLASTNEIWIWLESCRTSTGSHSSCRKKKTQLLVRPTRTSGRPRSCVIAFCYLFVERKKCLLTSSVPLF